MVFVSLTRLRLRSFVFLPQFAWHAFHSRAQVQASPGFVRGELLPDGWRTFWTLTAWENQEAMRAYMLSGAHKAAMPKLMHWCDEASVAHWTQEQEALPTWPEAEARMRGEGRISQVLHPSAEHAGMGFAPVKGTRGAPMAPKSSLAS